MAWRCTGRTNDQLVSNLREAGIIKHGDVDLAMRSTDRANFVLSRGAAYEDAPQPIGYASTISAPHMHAYALEGLRDKLHRGCRVLDIGCGSGYLVEAFSHMVGPDGVVVGIEHIPELAEMSKTNLRKSPSMSERMDSGSVHVYHGDGFKGWADLGPYDAIHVGAAPPTIPKDLVDQLKPDGVMVLPVGPEYGLQTFIKVTKDEHGNIHQDKLMGVSYVPLTTPERQLRHAH
eukprot:m.56829 g.56829  ORF g.56829 m.56829 type:complete len:232 (-) comp13034_c1_seq1:85-780(-)